MAPCISLAPLPQLHAPQPTHRAAAAPTPPAIAPQVDRSKDFLYVGSDSAALKYLDGTLPGDYGACGAARGQAVRGAGQPGLPVHAPPNWPPPRLPRLAGFDPLGLLDPTVSNGTGSGGFVNPRWLQYSEVRARLRGELQRGALIGP